MADGARGNFQSILGGLIGPILGQAVVGLDRGGDGHGVGVYEPSVAIEEQDIQRDFAALHPHGHSGRSGEDKEHSAIGTEMIATRQTLPSSLEGIGQLHVKRMAVELDQEGAGGVVVSAGDLRPGG